MAKLSELTDSQLTTMGVESKDDRKQLLAAVRKASGTKASGKSKATAGPSSSKVCSGPLSELLRHSSIY